METIEGAGPWTETSVVFLMNVRLDRQHCGARLALRA